MTQKSTYCVIDIETTTHTSYKRKANPFDPANWMVLVGYKKQHELLPTSIRLTKETQDHGWLVHILGNPDLKLLVGVNLKFDLLHALRNPLAYSKWQQFVARGGIVWDCQLAEYLLEGQAQSSHMMSLDDMSVKYGGDTKIDEVKLLWEAGVPTEDIDPDLLNRYLVGETLPNGERREGDIGNTELVFKKQLERARNSGQVRSIMLNMGSLCATIEMERNGMFVNRELGHKLAAELAVKLGEAQQRLQQYLPTDLPFDFSWTNRYHLSPLVFGGKVNYTERMYYLKDGQRTKFSPEDKPQAAHLFAYVQKEELHYVLHNGSTAPMSDYAELLPELLGNEVQQYKSGKQAGEYKTKKVKVDDLTKPKCGPVEKSWGFTGFTKPEPEWASSTEGLYSVAEDVITELGSRDLPFLKDLAAVRKMDKDLGTYFIREDAKNPGQYVGMLTMVQPDSIIHHSLNHTSTVTGRFSSSNPNLQNIPKGNKSDVKQVFESRFGTDGCIIQSDFSSLEVYIQAILTGAQNLIGDLKAGVDLHCMRLSAKEKMPYEEVLKLCKGYVDALGVYQPAVDAWDYKRTGAKVFSFQRAYGAGNKTIAAAAGMALEDVEALSAAEDARYPEIGKYIERRVEEIGRNRRPTNKTFPHPEFPAVICQIGVSRVTTPDGKIYTYVESPAMAHDVRRGRFTSFKPTEIKNYEFQGAGGEWMKAGMWLAVRAFYARNNFDGRALLVNTVHDAAYADAHNDVRLQAGALMHACMQAASDFMEHWFSWPLPLPVPTDTVFGKNMGEENQFVKGDAGSEFTQLADEYRLQLRAEYMEGFIPSYIKGNT